MADLPTRRSTLGGYLARLSAPVLALVGVLVAAGVGTGGYYAYQTYDYVQHDNDFCMSCHLMEQPFEEFAESAHRGLGCKACHQPTLVERSQMALTQALQSPDELAIHAEVPNERCAGCHIDGDPDKWRLIANSVGHRVHLESSDTSLAGLRCVECHSTGVHEFTPVDRTCAQSGCHQDSAIKLGAMSDLTIHCAACHNFVAPVDLPGSSPAIRRAAILPDREECLSCHVMRVLVDLPDPDPHGGVCSSCHNPHEQESAAEAASTCSSAGCHDPEEVLSTFHEKLGPDVVDNCVYCHQAHDFGADASDCLACHTGILDDSPEITLPHQPVTTPDTVATPETSGIAFDLAALGVLPVHRRVAGVGIGWLAQEAPPLERFLHSEHRDVGCGNCHSSAESHGQLTVETVADCRACHHTDPVSRTCARCHAAADAPSTETTVFRAVRSSVSTGASNRAMTFDHTRHDQIDCASCHTEGLELAATSADCNACHQEHHDPEVRCSACHVAAPIEAHPPAEAHVTCSGAGCHQAVPFESVPRTRELCLACHQDLREHRPEGVCNECHTLPAPRGGLR